MDIEDERPIEYTIPTSVRMRQIREEREARRKKAEGRKFKLAAGFILFVLAMAIWGTVSYFNSTRAINTTINGFSTSCTISKHSSSCTTLILTTTGTYACTGGLFTLDNNSCGELQPGHEYELTIRGWYVRGISNPDIVSIGKEIK